MFKALLDSFRKKPRTKGNTLRWSERCWVASPPTLHAEFPICTYKWVVEDIESGVEVEIRTTGSLPISDNSQVIFPVNVVKTPLFGYYLELDVDAFVREAIYSIKQPVPESGWYEEYKVLPEGVGWKKVIRERV